MDSKINIEILKENLKRGISFKTSEISGLLTTAKEDLKNDLSITKTLNKIQQLENERNKLKSNLILLELLEEEDDNKRINLSFEFLY